MKKRWEQVLNWVKATKSYDLVVFFIISIIVLLASFAPKSVEIVISYAEECGLEDNRAIVYVNSGNGWNDEEAYAGRIKQSDICEIDVTSYEQEFEVRIDPVDTEKVAEISKIEIIAWGRTKVEYEEEALSNIIARTVNVESMSVKEGCLEVTPTNDDPELYMSESFCYELASAMQEDAWIKMAMLFVMAIICCGRLLLERCPEEIKKVLRVGYTVMEIVTAVFVVGATNGITNQLQNITMIVPLIAIYMWGFIIFVQIGKNVNSSFMPLIATCMIGLISLLFGYINMLYLGCIAILISGGILFIYLIKKNQSVFVEYTRDYGVIYFMLISMALIFLHCFKDMSYHSWDEISHWGPFYKNIFLTDALPMYSKYPMTHGSYAQICSVIYYFFSFFISDFNEPSTYAVTLILINVCVATLFYVIPKKKYVACVSLGVVAATFLSVFSEMAAYSSIYIDALVGVMGGAIIILIYSLKDKILETKYFWLITIMVVAYSQVKLSGLPIALLCAGFYFVCYLLEKEKVDKIAIAKAIRNMIGMVVVVLLFYIVHKNLYSYLGGVDSTVASAAGKGLVADIVECYNDWKANGETSFWARMTESYLKGLLTTKLSGLPYVGWLIAFVGAAIFVWKSRGIEKKDKTIIMVLPVSTILLVLALYLAYMKQIFERALLLPSYNRYMTPLIVGCLMMVFVIIVKDAIQVKSDRVYNILMVVMAVVSCIQFGINKTENYFINAISMEEGERTRYQTVAERMLEYVDGGANVYIISQGNLGNVAHFYKYELTSKVNVLDPMPSVAPISCSIEESVISEESGTPEYTKISVNGFKRLVDKNDVDYIVVNYADDTLREGYGQLFSDGITTMYDWTVKVYRVDDTESQYQLVDVIYEE